MTFRFFLLFQSDGDDVLALQRFYITEGVRLSNMTINMLKSINTNNPGERADRRFVGALLIAIFGVSTLCVSSLFGNVAHNSVVHSALNATKTAFVRKLFNLRVGNDVRRLKQFNTIVNRHCNNSRLRQSKLN